MELRIVKGASTLDDSGLYMNGRIYVPGDALSTFVGMWQEKIIFFNSPLAGKRLCITVLSTDSLARGLPQDLEHFIGLCAAAGAQIIFHTGGKLPASHIIVAVEPGSPRLAVSYLGAALRSKPLARKLVNKVRHGLQLAYLPEPAPFRKPQYNLRLGWTARLFTPAVAIQWPADLALGAWLFAGLMEFLAAGGNLDGNLFAAGREGRCPLAEARPGAGGHLPEPQPKPCPGPPPRSPSCNSPFRPSPKLPPRSCARPAPRRLEANRRPCPGPNTPNSSPDASSTPLPKSPLPEPSTNEARGAP